MHRRAFLRRLGCSFAALSILGSALVIGLLGILTNALGLTQFDPATIAWAVPLAAIFFITSISLFILAGRSLHRFSAPLDEMLAASDRVAAGDYSVQVAENGPPEIRSLAHGFNSMTARLKDNDQQRRNMFADISHELRTPLTVIQGNVEGMLDGLYPAEEKILRSVLEETQLLSRLVDDLRTLSLAESGALQLKRETVDLSSIVHDTASGFISRADLAGIQFEVITEAGSLVEADPFRLRQVLSNLISNALRFTPRGGHVWVRCQGHTVTIQDDGPGIPSADLPHVFERFHRSGDSTGTGLGLSIARYLVEAHGGWIHLESESGHGTLISFILP